MPQTARKLSGGLKKYDIIREIVAEYRGFISESQRFFQIRYIIYCYWLYADTFCHA